MEKRMVQTNSPAGVLEDYLRSEDEESGSSSSREPTPDVEPLRVASKLTSRWHGLVQMIKSISKRPSHDINVNADDLGSDHIKHTLHPLSVLKFNRNSCPFSNVQSPRPIFSLHELQVATNNFSPGNMIGKGGYAEVYKGCLQNGRLVAIKRLIRGTTDEIIGDFLNEMGIMGHVNHPNTAKLIGYGVDGGMHIVLELSPRGSLASLLYGSKYTLTWDIRFKIALGIAEGVRYLHEGCQRRIIHRDIKAANILLTMDFEPQICDFGLAKWLPEHWTHHTVSKFEGTFGYLAPEYLMHGIVDEKTDVFAFGVLLLELVTGRRALDYSQQSLVLWAKPLLKKNDIKEVVDIDLLGKYNSRQLNLVLLAASLCIQQSSIRRPRMTQVVRVLNGDLSSLKQMKKNRVPFLRNALQEELLNEGEECKSSNINLV